ILIQNKWREIKFPGILLCLLLYLFFSLISFGWADNLSRAVIALRSLMFHAAILFLAINLIKTKKDFKIALFALPLTALLAAGEVIFKVYSLGGFREMIAREEIITPVGKWVYIAAIIILTLPLTYYLIFKVRSRLLKITLAIILGLGGLAVFLTLGKGEIIALILGFAYLFWKQKLNKRILIPILIAIILITAIPFSQYAGKFWERIVNIADDPNTQFRVAEFYAASEILKNHILLGVGAGNLKLAYKNLLPWSVESESNNFFLQVLLELGIIGFALLTLTLRAIYLEIQKARKYIQTPEQKLLYASFVATLIIVLLNAMVEATLIGLYYGIVFWYIVGLLFYVQNFYHHSQL
ncbi:MAG: O-antigen ligase family protein, partial [bacterium]|nr:O-antigen ligase family protein [bacterium]